MATNTPTDQKYQTLGFCDGLRDAAGKLYKFTPKEKLFVQHYLTGNFNGTAAARSAGYQCKRDKTFRQLACNILRKDHIKAAIGQAFEALTMSKFEMLYRVGRIAAGDLADVLNDNDDFDLAAARAAGTTYLLKKVKIKRTRREITTQSVNAVPGSDPDILESSLIDEEIQFEIHDPLRALDMIGKAGGVWVDRFEATGKDGKPLIPENPQSVVIYLPDNGRGDSDADIARAKAARTKGTARKTS